MKMKIYKVGGCVRDKLLGITPKDIDYVVVGSSEDEMINLGFKRVGNDFPVFLHPETKDEYALARIERKSGVGYNGFDFDIENITLEDDLSRRDLTINAMAEDENGNMPFKFKFDILDNNGLSRPQFENEEWTKLIGDILVDIIDRQYEGENKLESNN